MRFLIFAALPVAALPTPKDMLAGRQAEIHTERDRKLEAARKQRRDRRQQAA